MKKKRPYQSLSVKDVKLEEIMAKGREMDCDLGIDAAKEAMLICLRWRDGSFERPWRVRLEEVPMLIAILKRLREGRKVVLALEPTGVYGEPIRQALVDAGFQVSRVSAKASHDYAEVFDGVPSQHDGKDAACIAELAAMNKCGAWRQCDPDDQALRQEVDWLDAQQGALSGWLGRLEALQGRHWPELSSILKLKSATVLKLLLHYGGPKPLAQDAGAMQRLCKWGRAKLTLGKMEAIVQSAKSTLGVRQSPDDIWHLQRMVSEIERIRKDVSCSKRRLKKLTRNHAKIQQLAKIVGPATAAVCWAHLGDPASYHSGRGYLKAYGLNLKERSSGKFQGQLKITKRGPSRPRRWLYFAALRYSTKPQFNPWFQAIKNRGPGHAKRALVQLMRKLVLAMYQAGQGIEFDENKLLPGAKTHLVEWERRKRRTADRPILQGVKSNP